jgi:signal peptidase II
MNSAPESRWGSWSIWGVALLVLVADQLSKAWVVANLPRHVPVDVIPGLQPILSFTYLTNTGVAFGLMPQMGDLFTVLAGVVIVAILYFYRTLEFHGPLVHLALGLQVGGALGNLVDRLFRGSVVDFLDVNFWPFQTWPVFNLADSAIVVGVFLLLIVTWVDETRGESHGEMSGGEPGNKPGEVPLDA